MFDSLICFPKRLVLWFRSAYFGLNLKLVVLIAIVSLVGVLASSVLILTLQRQQLEQGALQSTTRLSDAINSSLEQAMLRNDRQMTQEIIRTIVDKQSVEHIQILDATGTVRISSIASQVGRRFDYSEPACQFCHLGDARPGKQSAIVETADDHSALFSINLIYNQPQCQSCHLPQEKILGLTMIEVPLDDLNNQVASGFWRIAFSAVIMFCPADCSHDPGFPPIDYPTDR